MIKCKTYPLTKPEMEAAKKFLDENQAMGYIEPTNSPYSSPFFFIKKKDGTLQPVLRFLGTVAQSEAKSVLLTQDLSLGFDLRLKS
jgi:hypothetical protein